MLNSDEKVWKYGKLSCSCKPRGDKLILVPNRFNLTAGANKKNI